MKLLVLLLDTENCLVTINKSSLFLFFCNQNNQIFINITLIRTLFVLHCDYVISFRDSKVANCEVTTKNQKMQRICVIIVIFTKLNK